MDLSPENYISVNEILADVLKTVDDGSFKLNSRGWYISQIQQALEELSFDTFFNKQNQSFDLPENLRLDMPKGAFNVRNVYLFNGDNCVIENSQNVYRKRNMINGTSGQGYVARDKFSNVGDPFHKHRSLDRTQANSRSKNQLFFFSMQNGMLMFSENCRKFQKVMIEYNGILADIGDTPLVPQFFRQAVKDYVCVPALETKATDKVGTNEYSHWMNLMNRYETRLNMPYDGSWAKAEHRAKQLNHKDRQDYKEYQARLNY